MKELHIIGNWKMHKTANEVDTFVAELISGYKNNKDKIKNVRFGIAAPATHFNKLRYPSLLDMELKVVAQDISTHDQGAYTGEISGKILKSFGADLTLIGHSERRQYHNETNELVNAKIKAALAANLVPVLCVGETLEEYEAGRGKEVVEKQVKAALKDINLNKDKLAIAYEPVWAIGTGKTATAEQAQVMSKFIRDITKADMIVLYGGSVKPENIEELMAQPDIVGALVGGASLKAEDFIKLLTLNK